MAGRNSLEMAKVDAVVETAADLFDNFADNIFHLVSDQTEENVIFLLFISRLNLSLDIYYNLEKDN